MTHYEDFREDYKKREAEGKRILRENHILPMIFGKRFTEVPDETEEQWNGADYISGDTVVDLKSISDMSKITISIYRKYSENGRWKPVFGRPYKTTTDYIIVNDTSLFYYIYRISSEQIKNIQRDFQFQDLRLISQKTANGWRWQRVADFAIPHDMRDNKYISYICKIPKLKK